MAIDDTLMFNSVRHVARESGRLLAHMLILGYPKKFDEVTLVGFSLGTQVIKSCLTELH